MPVRHVPSKSAAVTDYIATICRNLVGRAEKTGEHSLAALLKLAAEEARRASRAAR